jgi:propanol-preferring alcohol dehydrogenase
MTPFRCAHRWAFDAWGQALRERADDLPPPAPHEVTLAVTHCGVCHSDLHLREGGFDMGGGTLSSLERAGVHPPVTLGHEICGEVVETGSEVQGLAVGERVVAYPWIGCGECATCERGDDHLCVRPARNLGLQLPGGFADRVRVPHARYLVPIGTLDPARAATLACAGITAWSAVRKIDALGADETVAVVGCGGVGMTALALHASLRAGRVIAIDPDPTKREAALGLGAVAAFDPRAADAQRQIIRACAGPVAAVLDFVGSEASSALAVGLVRRAGQVVIVGLFGGEFRLPLPTFALKSLRLSGSYVGSLPDLRELVALAQRQPLPQTRLDCRPLAAVNAALADLAAGRVQGRVVLQP